MDGKSVEDSLPGGMHDWLVDRRITDKDFQTAGKLSEFEYQFRLVNGDKILRSRTENFRSSDASSIRNHACRGSRCSPRDRT
jgi:hypothetical protein